MKHVHFGWPVLGVIAAAAAVGIYLGNRAGKKNAVPLLGGGAIGMIERGSVEHASALALDAALLA